MPATYETFRHCVEQKKVDGKIEPKMTEADIRGIKIGHALLIHRRLEPMKIKLKELKVEKKVH